MRDTIKKHLEMFFLSGKNFESEEMASFKSRIKSIHEQRIHRGGQHSNT